MVPEACSRAYATSQGWSTENRSVKEQECSARSLRTEPQSTAASTVGGDASADSKCLTVASERALPSASAAATHAVYWCDGSKPLTVLHHMASSVTADRQKSQKSIRAQPRASCGRLAVICGCDCLENHAQCVECGGIKVRRTAHRGGLVCRCVCLGQQCFWGFLQAQNSAGARTSDFSVNNLHIAQPQSVLCK